MDSRVAIVTGGCRGIGYAICERLLPEWQVALVDLDDGTEQARELSSRLKGTARAYRLDISSESEVLAFGETLTKEYPSGIHALVNCAGIVSRAKPGEGDDAEEIRMFKVNVLGAQHLMNLVAPHMERFGSGSVVTISSMAGRMGADAAAEAYTGSKADLIGRSKQWAKFYGPKNIRCNVVAPGPVNTEMLKSWTEDQLQGFLQKTPLRRVAEPLDIANAVWFLLSDLSRHITGISLDVNGGYYIPT